LRKLILFLLVLLVIAGGSGVYGLYYIRPDPTLTLDYEPISLKDKALDMAKRLSPELVLTEEDVNNLLKQALAEHARQSPDVEVLGAKFTLLNNRLHADLRLLWKDRVTAGMQVDYLLGWSEPNLTAVVEAVKLKGIKLSSSVAQDLAVAIGEELPSLVRIRNVEFGEREIRIRLALPSLSELMKIRPGKRPAAPTRHEKPRIRYTRAVPSNRLNHAGMQARLAADSRRWRGAARCRDCATWLY